MSNQGLKEKANCISQGYASLDKHPRSLLEDRKLVSRVAWGTIIIIGLIRTSVPTSHWFYLLIP